MKLTRTESPVPRIVTVAKTVVSLKAPREFRNVQIEQRDHGKKV
jgi:hypothetical protein